MRIDLKGNATPNPVFALPDPGSDSTLPTLLLNLPDGQPFVPGPYIEQGYNHYEVWCVGAAGGQGGNGGSKPFPAHYFDPATIGEHDPNEAFAYFLSFQYYIVPDNPYHPGSSFTHYHSPYMDDITAWGGGGGGGGLQVVSGLLIALPDECPVVVGQAGADAPVGQMAYDGPLTPTTQPYPNPEYNTYDLPHPTFYPPEAGGDGGASSFNGETCQASGGKGGHPATVWQSGTRYWSGELWFDAQGGDGGKGGRTTAGGGAPGGINDSNAADGSWDGEIGKGGGGGRGGTLVPQDPAKPFGV